MPATSPSSEPFTDLDWDAFDEVYSNEPELRRPGRLLGAMICDLWKGRELHPLLPGAMRGDGAAGLKKQILSSKRLVEFDQAGSTDLIVCDYLAPMVNFFELDRALKTPLVLFQHNVESLIWKRHRDSSRNLLKKIIYQRQFKKTFDFETDSALLADGQIAVSEDEYEYFKTERGMKNTLGAVPTGVDFEYFKPKPELREPLTLAFLGSMDWYANTDAVQFFVGQVYPLIKKEHPEVRFLAIGRNPGPGIRKLGEDDPSITITGTVDDVRPWLARAAAMVLPLRVGGGTRIKVFEAMAAGIPVVSTSVGSEGLQMKNGETLLLADNAEDFANAVNRVLGDPALAETLARNALNHIESRYSWKTVSQVFHELCEKLPGKATTSQPSTP